MYLIKAARQLATRQKDVKDSWRDLVLSEAIKPSKGGPSLAAIEAAGAAHNLEGESAIEAFASDIAAVQRVQERESTLAEYEKQLAAAGELKELRKKAQDLHAQAVKAERAYSAALTLSYRAGTLSGGMDQFKVSSAPRVYGSTVGEVAPAQKITIETVDEPGMASFDIE